MMRGTDMAGEDPAAYEDHQRPPGGDEHPPEVRVPPPGEDRDGEHHGDDGDVLKDEHGKVEPAWGDSDCAFCWRRLSTMAVEDREARKPYIMLCCHVWPVSTPRHMNAPTVSTTCAVPPTNTGVSAA